MAELTDCEDASLTLEEALELIGGCDVLPDLDEVSCNSPTDHASISDHASETTTPKPKKRVRNPMNDVRRRQRKKAERLQLKEQAQAYAAVLERLKTARRNRRVSATSVSENAAESMPSRLARSPWLLTVVEEKRKRQEAERANRTLKALLVERIQMAGAMRNAFVKEQARLSEIDPPSELRLSLQPTPFFKASGLSTSGLQDTVRQVFAATDSVLCQHQCDLFESISRVRNDRNGGPSVELMTTTAMASDFKATTSLLWEALMGTQWPEAQSRFTLKTKQCSRQSVELGFSMNFENPQCGPLVLDGATLMEKRDEDSRTILAWTSLIAHPSDQLQFRSHGWIVVMKSPSDPRLNSVVKTCCRVFVEPKTNAHPAAHHDHSGHMSLEASQNCILRSMGHRVKSRLEAVQRQLLEHAGPQNFFFL